MTQMTTYSVPVVGPVAPDVMAQRIDDAIDAATTQNRGAAQPTYAAAGMIWAKVVSGTVEEIHYYDGDDDVHLFTVNPTSGLATLGADVSVAGANLGSDVVSAQTAATPADADYALIADTSNGSAARKSLVSDLWSLLLAAARSVTGLWTFTTAKMVTQTLVDGATINWDTAAGHIAKVTLGGNRTLAAPTNIQDGAHYSLTVLQDATGGRGLTWNSKFKFKSGTAPTLTSTASARDKFVFECDGTNLYEQGRNLDVK